MSDFFVQSFTGQTQSTASAATVSFAASVTAGNAIVVVVQSYNTSVTVAPTDNLGNTYVQIGGYQSLPGAGTRLSMWYACNISGGACTVSVTPSASAFLAVTAMEYTGFATSSPLDGNASAEGSATSLATGSIAVGGANELVIAVFVDFVAFSTGQSWLGVGPLDLDVANCNLNPGIGGSFLVCSGVRSSATNVTLTKSLSSYTGAFGASFTGTFTSGGGGGSPVTTAYVF